jgi:WD40 repeat protein/serine/threonine protein kinase
VDGLTDKSIKGYDLLERVGAGSFGVVYRAYQATIGREVALKVILPGFVNNPDFIRRFEAEAQLIARLEHLHIVPLYDYWREPGTAYLVMRWMRGGSLEDALNDGPIPLEDAATVLDQIAAALSIAHLNQIVHRDIKPSNILLDEEGNAYLADFGIARDLLTDLDEMPAAGAYWGSPGYLSPEQARNEPVTPRTDIFSLGVTMYEVLTGELPHRDFGPIERMYKLIEEPLSPIESLAEEITEEVNEVIQLATAKDPRDRFANPQSMANAFRRAARLGQPNQTAQVQDSLTLREQEILSLISEGQANKQIAEQLFIEHSTVKWHIRRIYNKLDVRSRRQAMRIARDLELLVPGNATARKTETEGSFAPSATPIAINPFKGLRAFETADSHHYFGREALIERLLARFDGKDLPTRTKQRGDAVGRFLAIIGPSGSGKSSLMKAGLIPALWNGDVPGSDGWFIATMTPGERPLDELEVALLRLASSQSENLRDHLERDRYGLLRAAELILPDSRGELVVLIDQFEELFLLGQDEDQRVHFLELLAAAATDPQSRIRIAITLRADYYDRPLNYPQFGELVLSNLETVLPLSAEELERAIAKPAEIVGVEYEEGLVTRIIDEVLYEPGALPLLQYALTELFEQRSGRELTHDAYDEIGGGIGALAQRAEELYQEQDDLGRETIRQMFLRLAALEEDPETAMRGFARRRVARSELTDSATDDDLMDELIDAFAYYRLLTLDHHPASRRPTVEVAHEALLREWARLGRWLNESRDDVRQERAVSRAAEDWDQNHRDESFLLHGARLEQVEEWRATSTLVQTPLVQEFISQSLLQRDKELQAETERKERESQLERRSQTFLRGLVAVFALATLVSGGLAFIARDQRQSALDSAADVQNGALVAGSQVALANNDTDTALALAWQAVALNPDSAMAQAQLSEAAYAPGTVRILEGNEDIVSKIAISPDDKTVVAGADDGTVILWDLATGQILWEQHVNTTADPPWVQDVAFSPDGQFVAATFDDLIMLWQAANGQLIRQIESPVNRQKIAFDPARRQFATIGSEEHSRLIFWDLDSGEAIREFDRGAEIEDITYTADGSAILIASKTGVLTLIDAQTGQVIYEVQEDLGTGAGALRYIALSPDGTKVSAAFANAGLLVWDLATGDLLQQFQYDGGTLSLSFHPEDGTVLVGGSGVVRTINPQTGEVLRANAGHSAGIIGLAITSDGKRAVTTAIDETVRLWNLQSGQVIRRFSEPNALLFEVALSPDGRTVLVGSTDGTVTLWDVETGKEIRRLVDDQPIMAVTFSPDGRKALIGAGYVVAQKVESGHIILWNVETGEEIRRFEGQPYVVADVEFSPDGRLAVSSGNGAMAILWDVETGEEIRRFDDYWVDSIWPIESYWDVEFSPDGKQIYASHASGPIIGWDVESGEVVQELVGHNGVGAMGIVFSDDGQRLVSGGYDGQAILWDVQTGNILRRFNNHAGDVGQVRFSPDETLLLGGSLDGTNSLWRIETGEVIRRYGGGFVISPNFSPDGRHAVVGYQDGAVELWRIDLTLDELLTWTRNNRYIPELTCEQRELYRIEPLCELES